MDTKELTISFSKADRKPAGLPKEVERWNFCYDPETVKKNGEKEVVSYVLFGDAAMKPRVPGPIQVLKNGLEISIDPRILQERV